MRRLSNRLGRGGQNRVEISPTKHRLLTDLNQLLRSRHWAQRLKLFSPRAARNMLLGNVRSRYRGRGMEFEEVRAYQVGDDIRTIDWKVSARAGGTYTKLFCEERERPCHIIVDQRSSMYFGSKVQFKSVLAAELASGLAWAALASGDRVGGQVIGDSSERDSKARHSKQAVLKFLHDLDELNHKLQTNLVPNDKAESQTEEPKATSLANSLQECQRTTRPGTAIFVISDFHDFDPSCAKALRNLSKHADLTLLQVVDLLEEKFPIKGNIAISNGKQSSRITVTNVLKKQYATAREEHMTLLKNAATQARALYTKTDTTQSARQTLTKLFSS